VLTRKINAAVRRAHAKDASLILIVLENCGYQHGPFGRFNALPRKGQPVRDHKSQRDAWYEIEEELRQVFIQLRAHKALKQNADSAEVHKRR